MNQAVTLPTEASTPPSAPDDPPYEIIDGRKVEKPPMGNYEVLVASILVEKLAPHARAHGLGRVVCEMLFRINPAGNPQLRPDVAFVSYGRWARDRKVTSGDGWDVVPDLAIEVVSRSNTASQVIRKVRKYLEANALRVWVVYPIERQVYIYDSPTRVRILGPGEDLDGEGILPGFHFPLAELFEDGAEE